MHLASIIPFLGVPESFITKVNVDSLMDSLSLAKRHGVKAFVYTSSATCVLDGADDAPAEGLDETSPYPSVNLEPRSFECCGSDGQDTYTTTKVAAEKAVALAHNEHFATVILRPSGVIGPGDKVLFDKLWLGMRTPRWCPRKLGENNVYIQGKSNGESLLDMVGVQAVATGHILAMSLAVVQLSRSELAKLPRKEVLKPDGRLSGGETAILNLSAGKGIQLPGRNGIKSALG